MNEEALAALIQTHLVRYPASALLDVYKLLHQATFGPGHLIPNRKMALEWLESETGMVVAAAPDQALVENIHPDGAIVRLHLGPYQERGGGIKLLLEAFVRSAEQVQGDPALMAQRWRFFEAWCRTEPPCAAQLSPREAAILGRIRAAESWPAVPHSPGYHTTYAPHYRVLTRAEAEQLCARQKLPFDVR